MTEGIFGAIIYGKHNRRIHTFYEITRKYSGRFASHMVHLRKPLLEWAGNDLIEIDMKINLQSTWCGDPMPILAEYHSFHENALAAPLIVGGKPMGPGLSMFVITDLNETHKNWLAGGRLIGVEIDVSFKEYIPFAEGILSQLGVPGFIGSGAI
jgi:Phage P2 GpU.